MKLTKELIQIIDNNIGYDALYVLNMAKADYHGSSIIEESRLIKFVKDYLKNKSSYKELGEKYFTSTSTVKKEMSRLSMDEIEKESENYDKINVNIAINITTKIPHKIYIIFIFFITFKDLYYIIYIT